MLEDEKNEQEKFDFTPDGEELGSISLDQAVLLSRQQAREDGEGYRQRLGWDEIVWSELSSEQREDTFRVVLQFRRPGRGVSEEQTGEEEFFFNQTGALVFRQVLAWPEEHGSPTPISTSVSSSPPNPEPVSVSEEGAISDLRSPNLPAKKPTKSGTPAYLTAIGVLGFVMTLVGILVAITSPDDDAMQVTAPNPTDISSSTVTATSEITPTATLTIENQATPADLLEPDKYFEPVVDAHVLANAWQETEIAAEVTYLDKIFVIAGMITKIEKKGGVAEVNLDGGSANGDIVCKFQPSQFSSIVEFAEGQQIVVQGRIIGVPGLYNVVVEECTVPTSNEKSDKS